MRFAIAAIIVALAVLGCTQKSEEAGKTLHVYCGAGMRIPMDEIAKEFKKEYGVKVLCDYAGSGYLLAKIEATKSGAETYNVAFVTFDDF